MIGDGARKLVERGMAARGLPLDERVIAYFDQHYLEHPCDETVLLPGARELLAAGLPCALVTNKPRAITILVLEHLEILTSFVEIWAGGDGPLKPAPDGILAVAARLEIQVHNTWMIGDGPQDIASARAAGAFAIGVPGIGDAEALRASQPGAIANSLLEVATWLRNA
jgi:phosphoglycolate phosphatase